jgi:beta-glucosidase
MAHESIVLLKNNNNTLPLKKDLKKIVVLGPNADNAISLLGNYNGIPSKLTTILQGIKEKAGPATQVVYERAINFTNNNILEYIDISSACSVEGKPGFKATYYKNRELSGEPVATAFEQQLNHNWQEGELVAENLRANDFSARYVTDYKAASDGAITFELEADDGVRFSINGKIVFDSWTRKQRNIATYTLATQKDTVYHLALEYWQGEGKATLKLATGQATTTDFNALAKKIGDADVFIVAGGISPQLEGEEMKVSDPGFKGGDRTSILLPAIQTELMKALHATGKPVVFVLLTGSAIAMPWEADNLPAIVNAWYGGQAAGTAVADMLFGDYNPSGRLPITFYRSDDDLPAFEDYSMKNRTYRYFTGKPLYGFGYGLSYTTFNYEQLTVPAVATAGKPVAVSVQVKNTGKLTGDEVVQLYLVNQEKTINTSLRALKGFQRITLKPGESRVVKFTLSPDDLSYVDPSGQRHSLIGKLQLCVGGSQPDEANTTSGNVVKKELVIKKR